VHGSTLLYHRRGDRSHVSYTGDAGRHVA
jgi:hypothetical protein